MVLRFVLLLDDGRAGSGELPGDNHHLGEDLHLLVESQRNLVRVSGGKRELSRRLDFHIGIGMACDFKPDFERRQAGLQHDSIARSQRVLVDERDILALDAGNFQFGRRRPLDRKSTRLNSSH